MPGQQPGLVRFSTFSVCFARPLKVREEADPFSLDVATMEKGHIVKVLEVSAARTAAVHQGVEMTAMMRCLCIGFFVLT